MKSTAQQRLTEALNRVGMSREKAVSIFNFVFAPNAKGRIETGNEMTWDTLLHDITLAINGIATNRKKWRREYVSTYERYLHVLRNTKAEITTARKTILMRNPSNLAEPTAPRVPVTVAEMHRRATARNRKLGIDGPTCTATWQTWVDPAVRTALTYEFARIHAASGIKGSAPRPFMGANIRRTAQGALKRFRTFIDNTKATLADGPTEQPTATTLYGALHLAALRQFELALDKWEKDYDRNQSVALTDPLPVNWHAMLSPTMRERIARAERDPTDIDNEGLSGFYLEKETPAPASADTQTDD